MNNYPRKILNYKTPLKPYLKNLMIKTLLIKFINCKKRLIVFNTLYSNFLLTFGPGFYEKRTIVESTTFRFASFRSLTSLSVYHKPPNVKSFLGINSH